MKPLRLLAFVRIPGNAVSFWVRRTLRWSRGKPALRQEAKDDLFAYLSQGRGEAEARAKELHGRYALGPLAGRSTAALYRKNLSLLDDLETATKDLPLPSPGGGAIRALDVGSQDWYYVFALERWLDRLNRQAGVPVELTGVELDGYEVYGDFHSRRDYAAAYLEQTGNPRVRYLVADFLEVTVAGQDIVFIFYPLLLRYQLLLWGLPLRYFAPGRLLAHAAALTRPGGWLVVFCHCLREHEAMLELGGASDDYRLLRAGELSGNLVDSRGEEDDRRFSVWRKKEY